LSRIGADEVIGVQGRYYHIPMLLWTAMLVVVARRRTPLAVRWSGLPPLLTTTALLCCVLANVFALDAVLTRFNSSYLPGGPLPIIPHM
jgi:hypothetical protein